MKHHYYIFAMCTQQGSYEYTLILAENEIIFKAEEENHDGTYYLEWIEKGQNQSGHFIECTEISYEGTPMQLAIKEFMP